MADRELIYSDGKSMSAKMAAAAIYGGNLVCINTSTGYAVAGTDAASRTFFGVAEEYKAAPSTAGGDSIECLRTGSHLFSLYDADAAITDVGSLKVYLYDATTVAKAASVSNGIFVGIVSKVESASKVWVDITVATNSTDVATHIADSSGAHAASAISFADSGSKTAATEVDAALDEIYVDITTAQATIPLPLPDHTATGSIIGSAGSVVFSATAEGFGLWWAGAESHASVATRIMVPYDLNSASSMTVELFVAKTGATSADSVSFNVSWYNNTVSALYDAGSNMGSNTSAANAEATSKTVQKLTLAIAAAKLPPAGSPVNITLAPKPGTLGTDAVVLLGGQVKYTKKILTS